MRFKKHCTIVFLIVLLPPIVFSSTTNVIQEKKNNDGSSWVINHNGSEYSLEYFNKNGKACKNKEIITPDIAGEDLSLDALTHGDISLVLNYPRDTYLFEFSSGEIPRLIKVCKEISLTSVSDEQVVSLLTLCVKDEYIVSTTLNNVKADALLAPKNLLLEKESSEKITNNKAWLFDGNKSQLPKKPYLIKGGKVRIINYSNSWLQVEFASKNNNTLAWIELTDVL